MYHLMGYFCGRLEIDQQYDTIKEAQQHKWMMLAQRRLNWKFKIVYQRGG